MEPRPTQPRLVAGAIAAAATLTAACIAVAWISPTFEYGSDPAARPIVAVVALLVLAGGAYLCLVYLLTVIGADGRAITTGIVLGIALRLAFFFSTPVQEDDFYRYLWDGAATAHGHSPYRFSPAQLAGDVLNAPAELRQLRDDADIVFDRINFPELTTIYPPVAQLAFAAAHAIAPFSLHAWRLVVFALDVTTLVLLLRLLSVAGVSPGHALIYWLNPVLLLELYNSAHMDIVALPLVTGALLFAHHKKSVASMAVLAAAVAAKLWPMLLMPILVRTTGGSARRQIGALSVGVVFSLALLAPMLKHATRTDAGLTEYSERWEMNDALFLPIAWIADRVVTGLGGTEHAAGKAARIAVAVLVLTILAWASRTPAMGPVDVCNRAGIVVGALFLLSPAPFPWYYVWLLPFLAVRPRASLLLLSATLPLYYLKFHYAARGQVDIFHTRIVWLEFGPVLVLAAWEAARAWRRRRTAA